MPSGKGHKSLNKPAVFRGRFVLVCMNFSSTRHERVREVDICETKNCEIKVCELDLEK